jgi:uncharacterized NAD(P)/FAD-binding protein YdhS
VSHITIIGAGFSGTALAIALARQAGQAVKLALVDPRDVGTGIAYGTRIVDHWLNVPARGMSLEPDKPDDFLHWWAQNQGQEVESLRFDFAPRLEYARYLAEKISNIGMTYYRHKALSIEKTSEKSWRVILADGQQWQSDQIVLAMGNSLPQPTAFGFADPWQLPDLSDLAMPVFILGTGLTMIDAVMSLDHLGHYGPILALSRRGLVPQSHDLASLRQPSLAPPKELVGLSPWRVMRGLRQLTAETDDWRRAVDSVRSLIPAIWQQWTQTQKQQFLRHLQSRWDIRRHRMAPAIADRLQSWQRSGRLRVVAGKITDVVPGWNIEFRPRGQKEKTIFPTGLAIDCSGRRTDPVAGKKDPLVGGLLAAGLVRADSLGLGFDSDGENRLVAADGRVTPGFWAAGPLVRGAAWENTAVPELRQEATALAKRLLATVV